MSSPVTKDELIHEISLLPEEKLGEVYNLIHSFRLGAEETKQKENDILSFSGSWKDIDEKVFDGFLSDISERRSKAFSGRGR